MPRVQAYGEPVAFERDEPIPFLDFSLTYLGEESSSAETNKSTASFTRRSFQVRETMGRTQTLVVRHGQIPPQPVAFQVEEREFSLLSYQMPGGERLYPDRLAVIGPGTR